MFNQQATFLIILFIYYLNSHHVDSELHYYVLLYKLSVHATFEDPPQTFRSLRQKSVY